MIYSFAPVCGDGRKKGPGLFCAKHPKGRSGKTNQVLFSGTGAYNPDTIAAAPRFGKRRRPGTYALPQTAGSRPARGFA